MLDHDLKGHYSNMAQISHTQEEFILDFFSITPPVGVLASRVIVSPGHLKRLIAALVENMKNYETNFGTVASTEPPQEFGFQLQK